MKLVTIYTKETCPYCNMAKQLLSNHGVREFHEIRIDLNEKMRDEMISRTNRRTVPQIFIGDFYVGGYDDLVKLKQESELDKLLSH